MNKFVVLKGTHSQYTKDKNGNAVLKTYKSGEIVESENDLVVQFKNKFARADGKDKDDDASETERKLKAELDAAADADNDDDDDDESLLELKMIKKGEWTVINEDGDEVVEGTYTKKDAQKLLDELS